jgi:HPt (histidine-containing phosphotransfer) domain-containing protein
VEEKTMTARECYEAIGADYDAVLGRLIKEERVEKFLKKVPEDPSYNLLCESIEKKNLKEAFRASHTIKGICQNLSLDRLGKVSEDLTELLRNAEEYTPEIEAKFAILKEVYEDMVECINRFEQEE